jgi:hypothetical protein
MNHLRLFRLVDDVNAVVLLLFLWQDVVDGDVLAVVCRQQMLLQERLVAEALLAVNALGDFEVDFVVATEGGFVAEGHEADVALIWLGGAVDEEMLLKGGAVRELFSAKLCEGGKRRFEGDRGKTTRSSHRKCDL